MRKLLRGETVLAPAGNRTPDRPTRNLFVTPTVP